MTTATKKEHPATTTNIVDSTEPRNVPVQHVRDIALEERLDKLILLIEAQNKAWQKSLTLLTEINTLMLEKYKSADILLEEHPPVRNSIRERTAATGAPQPQPFNNYSDSLPYGTDLEEEREAPPESFPAAQTNSPEHPHDGPHDRETYGDYNDSPVPESAPPMGQPDTSAQQPKMRVTPGPPVSSKAELLERVEKVT
tara:strand:+ start:246 stop:839 length:594 start_codon:yes stop_codon:yes gene_type:complete